MNARTVTIVAILILLVAMVLFLPSGLPSSPVDNAPSGAVVHELGRAGETGYAVVTANGSIVLRLLALNTSPAKTIFVLKDLDSIEASRFDEFVDGFTPLAEYGYTVRTGTFLTDFDEGILLVPTGAMPAYVLDVLPQRPNLTVIYLGEPDLLIQNGIKSSHWYAALDPSVQSRMVVFNTTLDRLHAQNTSFLPKYILDQRWSLVREQGYTLSNGTHTVVVPLSDADFLRAIVQSDSGVQLHDSVRLPVVAPIEMAPSSIFPWETSTVRVALNRTQGTARFIVFKDGRPVYEESIGRVNEPNLFFYSLAFDEPGNYVLRVTDRDGERASGLLHVQDLDVALVASRGSRYIFNVTLDGLPVESGEAYVRLNHSDQEVRFFIRDGELAVPARLRSGTNLFVVRLLGTEYRIPVENTQEGLLDVYIKYGLPGFLLVALVYAAARLSRKPTYRVRFDDAVEHIRRDIPISSSDAIALFSRVRHDLDIRGPLTAKEFAFGLKRHVTEGAEVTDGNVEDLLKKLIRHGRVETYLGYYQLRSEGNVQHQVLRRMVRDVLIEEGIAFQEKTDKFVLRDTEIGFFGSRFEKRAFIVLAHLKDKPLLLHSLSDTEQARYHLQELNGRIQFVTIDMLKRLI